MVYIYERYINTKYCWSGGGGGGHSEAVASPSIYTYFKSRAPDVRVGLGGMLVLFFELNQV